MGAYDRSVDPERRHDSEALLREAARHFDQDVGPGALATALERLGASLPEAGAVLGDYRLGPVLGQGGMGIVYLAEQVSVPGRRVAVKLLRRGSLSPLARQRFAREVEVIGRLDHPHIVPILSADVHGDVPFFAMKFVDGRSLREVVRAGTLRGDFRAMASLLRDLATALHHAHLHGVVHRDVKPGNVLVDAAGRPMLLDFGLACLTEGSELTMTSESLGTLDYMAPEQIEPTLGPIEQRTDVYGLGVTAYECLCGSTPFATLSRTATIARILRGEVPAPRTLDPTIPRDLATICQKAMQARPKDRYRDAAAMAADLDAFLAYRPISARPHGWPARLAMVLRRNRWAAASIATLLLTIVAVVVHFAFLLPQRTIAAKLDMVDGWLLERDAAARSALDLATDLRTFRLHATGAALDSQAVARERELRTLQMTARRLDETIESEIEQCLSIDPGHPKARRLRADQLAARIRELLAGSGAVTRRDALAITQERLLRVDDDGRHADLLDAFATLSVACAEGPAALVLCPAVEGPDGTSGFAAATDATAVHLGNAPSSVRVAEGSWLLHAKLADRTPVVLPLLVRRHAVALPAEHRIDVSFLPAAALADGFRQVHAGFGAVADSTAMEPDRDELAWHDGFAIAQRELRTADWLLWSGDAPTPADEKELAAGRPVLKGPTWDSVTRMLARLNEREVRNGSGCFLALPTPEQWRRAGQGADGRPWPWGFWCDGRLSRNYWSTVGPSLLLEYRESPAADCSPFGIHELAGSMRELCLPANAMRNLGTKQFAVCGGSIYSVTPDDLSLRNERTFINNDPGLDVGLRLVRMPLPTLPIGPLRLDLSDLVPKKLRTLVVRGPIREELGVDERVRFHDGAVALDGYEGSFSGELIAYHPVRMEPARTAVDIELTFRCNNVKEERSLQIVLGTHPGFDTHDERIAWRIGHYSMQLINRAGMLQSTSFPRLADGSVVRLRHVPTPDGGRSTLSVDGREVAQLTTPPMATTAAAWRYFAIRLPSLAGMTATIHALRVESP